MHMTCFGFLIFFTCFAPEGLADQARFCDVAEPIMLSRADTRLTKEQADRLNRVGKRICGWGRKNG